MNNLMKFYFLIPCIFWLTTCTLWGQLPFGIKGYLENERLILEVEKHLLDVPMLLVRHEMGFQQVTWSKEGNYLLLTIPLIQSEAGFLIPPFNINPRIDRQLLGRFPIIKEYSMGEAFGIDATDLFLKSHIQWNLNHPESIRHSLSYIHRIDMFNDEIVIRTRRTIDANGINRTIDADFSFYRLPEPMRPRIFDHRMGFYSEGPYSSQNHKMESGKGTIQRWRLVPKDTIGSLKPPIKPIILYLDPQMPEQWKPYVKAGIMEWSSTFEAAGFSNVLEVRELPSDAIQGFTRSMGCSMIHWDKPVPIRGRGDGGSNCQSVTDFRTGEILKIDIYLTNLDQMARDYFLRCSPLDPRAHQFPFPVDLMGDLLQSVTAHEMGHGLGLRDANYGEHGYPFEKVRDTQWLRKMGFAPSIMSYSRNHHIPQPKDSIPTDFLVRQVGPMDQYQILWGYGPVPEGGDAHSEQHYLDNLIRIQDTVPWYRFNFHRTVPALGPNSTDEVADNDNPIGSMALGLENLQKVVSMMPGSVRGQGDDSFLTTLHEDMLRFWYKQMSHVLSMVGGYNIQYKSREQSGPVFSPIAQTDQNEALDFILDNAFNVPLWLSRPEYISRWRMSTEDDLLLYYQILILKDLLDAQRLKRLEFMETKHGYGAWTNHILVRLREGLFQELQNNNPKVPRRRQVLQNFYIKEFRTTMANRSQFNMPKDLSGGNRYLHNHYVESIMSSECQSLYELMLKAVRRSTDSQVKAHWTRCLNELKLALKGN